MTQEELEEVEDSSTSTNGVVKLEDLVKHETEGATFAEETLRSLNAGSGAEGDEGQGREECPLCLDMMEAPVLIPPCMHRWWVNGFVRVNRVAG